MGVWFVPATGRTFSEIPEISDIKTIRYFILSNGAVILDRETNYRSLECLSKELAKIVFDIVFSYDVHITVNQNCQCFVDANCQTDEIFDFHNVCHAHMQVVKEFAVYEENFKDKIYSMDDIEVVSVFFHDADEENECKKRLEEVGQLLVVNAFSHNLEIFSARAGKGGALRRFAKMLGVDINETIGIGDSPNDITMLDAAGLGLAVKNSGEELKKHADEIICTNDEHVVKFVLENWFK